MWKLIICASLLSAAAEARTLELKHEGRSIFLQEKTGWKLSKDLFGIPYIYFSPEQNGQRTNISFTDTGAEVEFDVNSLEKTQDVYQNTKKKWATSVGAKPQNFLPYEVSANKLGHKIHRIGFTFEHEGKNYVERSFYIECRGKVLFSKALRLEENEQHDKEISDLLSTLDCGGV